MIRNNILPLKRGSVDVLEDYSTDKEDKPYLVIETGNIGGKSIMLWVNIPQNFDKKHEEYIKALGEGKKIV